MEFFLKLCTVFINGIASFFDIEIPFIGISMLQLLGGLFIIKCILVAVKIIFGTDHGQDVA